MSRHAGLYCIMIVLRIVSYQKSPTCCILCLLTSAGAVRHCEVKGAICISHCCSSSSVDLYEGDSMYSLPSNSTQVPSSCIAKTFPKKVFDNRPRYTSSTSGRCQIPKYLAFGITGQNRPIIEQHFGLIDIYKACFRRSTNFEKGFFSLFANSRIAHELIDGIGIDDVENIKAWIQFESNTFQRGECPTVIQKVRRHGKLVTRNEFGHGCQSLLEGAKFWNSRRTSLFVLGPYQDFVKGISQSTYKLLTRNGIFQLFSRKQSKIDAKIGHRINVTSKDDLDHRANNAVSKTLWHFTH